MSKPKHKDHDVGYGKPPKETRWKKGQSGNPKGRPKKKTDFSSLVKKELERMVLIKEGDTQQTITKKEAIVKRLMAKALAGDVPALKAICDYIGEKQPADSYQEIIIVIDEDDAKTIRK